jgi:glycosyltransferase involved in cell wall biosynthesis
LSNIHEVFGCHHDYQGRQGLVFIGGFGHPPNVDAIRWIVADILPALRARMPEITVHIVGDIPDGARAELSTPGLVFHGRVPDLAPLLERALASLAPLRFGAGVKGKINMAMSYGVPVIATSTAVEGMQLRPGKDVLVAEDGQAFADAVATLAADELLWDTLSRNGLENVSKYFSRQAASETLRRVLD